MMENEVLTSEKVEQKVEVSDITNALKDLLPQYPQVAIIVDHEGVTLPYGFGALQRQFENDPWSEKRLHNMIGRMNYNIELFHILTSMQQVDKAKVTMISGSGMDVTQVKNTLPIGSSPRIILPELLVDTLERGHTFLGNVSGKKEVPTIGNLNEPSSLLLFLNDVVIDGLPPKELTSFLVKHNKNYSTFNVLTAHIPRFVGENNPEYDNELKGSIYTALKSTPQPGRILKKN